MPQVSALSVVSPLADRLLESDLPDLPSESRQSVLAFVCHRVDTLPSFTRFGVLAIGTVFHLLLKLPGGWAICRALMALPLPFVAEYPRLIRSLGFAYVWEHWPDTSPTGAQPEVTR